MTYDGSCSAGYSNHLIYGFAEIFEEIRCSNSVFDCAERNVGRAGECLGRVHAELARLYRAIDRLTKVKPLWFDKNGCGLVDKNFPELNARALAFARLVNHPMPVFDDDHFMNMSKEADALVHIMQRMRRRVRRTTRKLLLKK